MDDNFTSNDPKPPSIDGGRAEGSLPGEVPASAQESASEPVRERVDGPIDECVEAPPIQDLSIVVTPLAAVSASTMGGFAATVCRPPAPRIWSALIVGAIALPLGLLVSGVAAVVLIGWQGGGAALMDRAEFSRQADALTMTPTGLAAMVIPGQVVFIGLAFGAAWLSPEHWRQRLRLVRGRMPLWTWPILAMATPAIGFATSIVLGSLVSEPSEHARQLELILRGYDPRLLPMLFLLVAALPGLAEELLYRGYIQSRLLRAWPARVAILLSAVMFGVAHIDPFHALAVIPLGIWLGVVSWKADSLGPAILGHMTNNGLALALARGVNRDVTPPSVPPSLIFAVFIAFSCLLASFALLTLAGRPDPRRPASDFDGQA